MNMHKPITIEFTGTPNSGKTTLLKVLPEILNTMHLSSEVMIEDAELVPKCIPKKTWARNVWITHGQFQSLIQSKYSNADIVFFDRGFYDAVFWANFLATQNTCTKEESESLLRILNEMDSHFSLKPDFLFVFDVSSEESMRRRLAQSNEPVTMSNTDFLEKFKASLNNFCETVTTPIYRIDTTHLDMIEMQTTVLSKVLEILKKA